MSERDFEEALDALYVQENWDDCIYADKSERVRSIIRDYVDGLKQERDEAKDYSEKLLDVVESYGKEKERYRAELSALKAKVIGSQIMNVPYGKRDMKVCYCVPVEEE